MLSKISCALMHYRKSTMQTLRLGITFFFLFFSLIILSPHAAAQNDETVNDHIFPPSVRAQSYINFDRRGFIVDGKRTFLVSAGIEYARVPHELWQDRLLRLKRAGFNTVEIYTFWNFHEPREGEFNFSGDHDLNAFLQLVHQMGMYSIVRVGPYYCAEWTLGGYPLWLHNKVDVSVREPNAAFEHYVDLFFNKLIPIVASNQINRGGSVILVQLENEHPKGWGTIMPNSYFKHLQEKALSLGIEVPYFFSGLHHSNDPAGDAANLDDASRPNPWFSTEFWSVWYDHYGPKPEDASVFGRRAWKIIAHGGNGYNVYMAHGGTNFGYSNDHEDAASYDYGAAVGQAGDLRPLYYSFKNAAWFAQSFSEILENSVDNSSDHHVKITNTSLKINVRHSPSGDFLFLDNPTDTEQTTDLENASTSHTYTTKVTLHPKEILAFAENIAVQPDLTLTWSTGRILGKAIAGNTTTFVLYGPDETSADLFFKTSHAALAMQGKEAFQLEANDLHLTVRFLSHGPRSYVFKNGTRIVRILAVDEEMATRTWFLQEKDATDVVVGPKYVGELHRQKNAIQITTELPWSQANKISQVLFFGEKPGPLYLHTSQRIEDHPKELLLSHWEVAPASQPANKQFDDQTWLQSNEPLQMGADQDDSANAWYRTTFSIKSAGQYLLHFDHGGDNAVLYLDGIKHSTTHSRTPSFTLNLSSGSHTAAIFTNHNGRDKLYTYIGPLSTVDQKGLSGNAELWSHAETNALLWRALRVEDGSHSDPPLGNNSKWKSYKNEDDVFAGKPGFAWFIAEVKAEVGRHQVIEFPGSNQDLSVYINGALSSKHERWTAPFSLNLDSFLEGHSSVTVTLLLQNHEGSGGIGNNLRLISYENKYAVRGWRMRGGFPQNQILSWQSMSTTSKEAGPSLFRNTFDSQTNKTFTSHPIWRITTSGLSHGNIWINGHNLGRYPEKIPVDGMYIPECWVKPQNTVLVYDEEGTFPENIKILPEQAASRDVLIYSARLKP